MFIAALDIFNLPPPPEGTTLRGDPQGLGGHLSRPLRGHALEVDQTASLTSLGINKIVSLKASMNTGLSGKKQFFDGRRD